MSQGRTADTPDIVAIDLDEDTATVAVDTNTDNIADIAAIDLDEETIASTVTAEIDEEAIALDEAEAEAMAAESTWLDEAEAMAAASRWLDEAETESASDGSEGTDEDGGSLMQPPDDITNEDLRQAQQDQQHTSLMGQYMRSRGVIS